MESGISERLLDTPSDAHIILLSFTSVSQTCFAILPNGGESTNPIREFADITDRSKRIEGIDIHAPEHV